MSNYPQAPGAAPFLQGYWWHVEGRERDPPKWDHGHYNPEWISEFLRGYDDSKSREKNT